MQGALRSLKIVYISIMAFLEKVFTATSNFGIAERSRKFSGKKTGPMAAFHRYLVAVAVAARQLAEAAVQLLRSQLASLSCSTAVVVVARRLGWQQGTDCCWQLPGQLSSRQLAAD